MKGTSRVLTLLLFAYLSSVACQGRNVNRPEETPSTGAAPGSTTGTTETTSGVSTTSAESDSTTSSATSTQLQGEDSNGIGQGHASGQIGVTDTTQDKSVSASETYKAKKQKHKQTRRTAVAPPAAETTTETTTTTDVTTETTSGAPYSTQTESMTTTPVEPAPEVAAAPEPIIWPSSASLQRERELVDPRANEAFYLEPHSAFPDRIGTTSTTGVDRSHAQFGYRSPELMDPTVARNVPYPGYMRTQPIDLRKYGHDKRVTLRENLQVVVGDIGGGIDSMKAKSKTLYEKPENLDQMITALEKKEEFVQDQINRAPKISKENWGQYKSDLFIQIQDLESSYEALYTAMQ